MTTTVRVLRVVTGLPLAAAGAGVMLFGVAGMTQANEILIGAGFTGIGLALIGAARAILRDQLPSGLFALPEADDDDVFVLEPDCINPTTGSLMPNGPGGVDTGGHFYGQIIQHDIPRA